MTIELSKIQKEFLPAIEWLVSDEHRAEGRTFLLAIAFYNKCNANPGEWVSVQDHFFGSRQATQDILIPEIYRISQIVNPDSKMTVSSSNLKVKLT
jgi:hypothetical protein